MRNWYKPAMALVGCSLLAVPLLALARPDDKSDDDKDKAQARKELKDLEDQRAKLDSRIRDLRKKAGVPGGQAFIWRDGQMNQIQGLDGDHRIIIERAMGDAHKAVEEAMKNLPNFENFNFNFEPGKDGSGVRIWTDKDGKTHARSGQMSEEERKKFQADMEKMRAELRENLKGLKDLKELKGLQDLKELRIEVPGAEGRTFVAPRVEGRERNFIVPRIVEPRRGESDDTRALRDELRSLRDEVEKLRDEVKRGRGGKSSEDLDRFDKVQFL